MSRSYDNILVPYDGSTYSQKALRMAFNMARAFDSSIYLVNVIDTSTISSTGRISSKNTRKNIDEIKHTIKKAVESHLQRIQKDHRNSGIIVKGFILEGNITRELLKFIKDYDIDLVIIGSNGLTQVSKIIVLGSVCRKISELVTCPIVIVR